MYVNDLSDVDHGAIVRGMRFMAAVSRIAADPQEFLAEIADEYQQGYSPWWEDPLAPLVHDILENSPADDDRYVIGADLAMQIGFRFATVVNRVFQRILEREFSSIDLGKD